MTDLKRAKVLMEEKQYTCVLVKGESTYYSDQRGIKPLLAWLDSKNNFCGFSAADKVVGKAAAFLYIQLNIQQLYAQIIRRHALKVLQKYGIWTEYDVLADAIRNRADTGFCPMESAVLKIEEPNVTIEELRKKVLELTIKTSEI